MTFQCFIVRHFNAVTISSVLNSVSSVIKLGIKSITVRWILNIFLNSFLFSRYYALVNSYVRYQGFFFNLRLCMYEISFCNVTDKFVTAECLFSDPSLVSTKGDK